MADLHQDQGRKAVMEIALDLRNGLEGFPENPPLAFRWLQAASSDFDYPPAHFLYAQWIRDDDLFSLRSKDNPFVRPDNRQGEYLMANSALLHAADHHDIRAETEILRLLKAGPDYERRSWAIYYWLLRLERHGTDVPANELTTAKAKLPKDVQSMIETWDTPLLPAQPRQRPPFTRLPAIP